MPKVLPIPVGGGGGRSGRGRRVSTTLAEINVIPLVDVMLVLLIIFMVTAPMLQRGVEVNLPVASRAQEISSERIFVDVPLSFRDDQRVFLGKEPVRIAVLAERLRQMLVTRSDKHVFFRIDRQLTVQHQIDVVQQLNAAGVQTMGLVTEPPPIR
jgi:biopolymer transport protein ExbD